MFTRLHRGVEVSGDFFQESGGGQPLLIGANQKREIFGHKAGFDGINDDFFQCVRECHQLCVVVEFGAVLEATGPSED